MNDSASRSTAAKSAAGRKSSSTTIPLRESSATSGSVTARRRLWSERATTARKGCAPTRLSIGLSTLFASVNSFVTSVNGDTRRPLLFCPSRSRDYSEPLTRSPRAEAAVSPSWARAARPEIDRPAYRGRKLREQLAQTHRRCRRGGFGELGHECGVRDGQDGVAVRSIRRLPNGGLHVQTSVLRVVVRDVGIEPEGSKNVARRVPALGEQLRPVRLPLAVKVADAALAWNRGSDQDRGRRFDKHIDERLSRRWRKVLGDFQTE